jgi:alpha-aminoadipic semialdehyde synthase
MKIRRRHQESWWYCNVFFPVCGGLPAPEAADNPLKYKFSWSPKGGTPRVRTLLDTEVTLLKFGSEMLQAALFVENWPDLHLECLPNRDSLKYEKVY